MTATKNPFKKSELIIFSITVLVFCVFTIMDRTSRDCSQFLQKRVISGNSLTGLLENGQKVRICYSVENISRDDIVAYQLVENREMIKIVKAIPGDTWQIQVSPQGDYNLIVNNQVVVNHQSEPYRLQSNQRDLLMLYQRDYGSTIPNNAYLIFGNDPTGSQDSSRFGLVSGRDIRGIVIR